MTGDSSTVDPVTRDTAAIDCMTNLNEAMLADSIESILTAVY